MSSSLHATTIFAIRHNGHSAMAGDGQVTLGEQVIMIKLLLVSLAVLQTHLLYSKNLKLNYKNIAVI